MPAILPPFALSRGDTNFSALQAADPARQNAANIKTISADTDARIARTETFRAPIGNREVGNGRGDAEPDARRLARDDKGEAKSTDGRIGAVVRPRGDVPRALRAEPRPVAGVLRRLGLRPLDTNDGSKIRDGRCDALAQRRVPNRLNSPHTVKDSTDLVFVIPTSRLY
jgi:hypothetical protein